MKRLKVLGALLSAAAMALTMPLSALADTGADKVETISTTGWVEVSNAHPQKGDVISMTISLAKNAQYRGISGFMKSVEGARPVLGPDAASSSPEPTATASAEPSETATVNPTAKPTADPTDDSSEEPTINPTEDPTATATEDPGAEPSASTTESSEEPAESSPTEDTETPGETKPGDGETGDDDQSGTAADGETSPGDGSQPGDNEDDENQSQSEPEDSDNGSEGDAQKPVERDPDKGWMGLLSEKDLFIVLGEDISDGGKKANSAVRYFQITGEPGSTVQFSFSGRYSDGKGDHLFVATHTFQVASGTSEVSNELKTTTTGTVRTVDGSSLQFRLWPELTTIEGIRAATMKTKGTSPGELLRSLRMSSQTKVRVYRGDSSIPRLSAICTGDTVRFSSNARGGATEAVAVVRGDLLGTGKVGLNQLVAMSKLLAGQIPLDEAGVQAADVNGDGEVTPADASVLKKLMLGRQ